MRNPGMVISRLMKSRIAAALSLWLSGTGWTARTARANTPTPVSNDHPPVLVELFTSQGCSSCPAADAFVRDLPRLGLGRDRVLPLTFHVDYWDDLGWKDPFASPAFSERQRRYAHAGVLRTPSGQDGQTGITGAYTPQMIVNGEVHFSGGRRDLALTEIQRATAAPALTLLVAEATIDGDRAIVTARLSSRAGTPLSMTASAGQKASGTGKARPNDALGLTIALAMRSARTAVTRGENGGETLDEAAIVRVLSDPIPIATASDAPVRVTVAKPRDADWKDVELTAFVQSVANLRVIAARAVNLPRR
jgi:hypothetical protein